MRSSRHSRRFFSRTPELSARIEARTLRFLSDDTAIDEGEVVVRRGPAASENAARYTALLVREGPTWKIASLSESVLFDTPSVDDLSWLVGRWKSSTGAGAAIETTYRWLPGKRFLLMQFSIDEAELSFAGTQVIGVDPASGKLHSWTYESDGGIGEADWLPDEDHWVLDAVGTLADGSTLAEANILRRIDEDAFTWQSTNRLLDGEPLPDLAPVRVERVESGDSD